MNKRHLTKLTLIGTLFIGTQAFSQTTINTAANSVVIKGNTFEYSIGEMSLISTENNSNLIITQGYLQPSLKSNSQGGNSPFTMSAWAENIKVYPNPTDNTLYIETRDAIANIIHFQLYDALGKIVLQKAENQNEGLNKFSLDLKSFAAGSYFLILKSKNDEKNTISFKIQKKH